MTSPTEPDGVASSGSSIGGSISLGDLEGEQLHGVLARLREREPVSWVPAVDGWLVTRRSTAIEVMRDDETFTVDDPRFTTGRVVGPSMLSLDGSEHDRHRAPFVAPYQRRALGPLEDWIETSARRILATLVVDGTAELRSALAAPLATATIHRSLGLVDTEPDELLGWYRAIVGSVSALSAGAPLDDAGPQAMRALRAAVARTVARDPDSMLGRLAGDELDDDELAQNTAIVLFGAIETQEGMTANALWYLLSNADQLDEVRRDTTLVPNAVEESLRLEPAASVVDRYATADVTLMGAPIAEGDLVRVSLAGANRDPEAFDEPDAFDIRRRDARLHLAFASGPHVCLGLVLARVQTVAAINAVLDLLPDIELDPDRSSGPTGLIFRKPGAVTATWSA